MGKLVENFEKLTAEETDDADFRIYKSQNLNYPFSHRHSFFEFYYITGGKGYDIINGEKYALEEGAFLLFSPYHIHKTVSSPGKPPEGYVGCISMNCVLGSGTLPVNFDKLLSSSGKDEVYMKFAGEEHMTLSAIFEKAAGEYKTKKSYREYMIAAFISIILVMFKRASGAAEQPERHFAGRGNMWDIIRYVHNNYSENMYNHTQAYNGILKILEELHKDKVKIGVVSNKFDSAVKDLCKKYFGDLVDTAIGQNDDVPKKPAPDGVLKAMKILGSDKNSTIYAGDSDVDVQTAKNAGLKCIGVTWGFRTKDYLKGADFIVDSPDEILKIVRSL